MPHLFFPLIMWSFSSLFLGFPVVMGWAKPVPVDWRRLKDPRWDMALVALAGPGANLLDSVTVMDLGAVFYTPNFVFVRSEDRSKCLIYYIEKQDLLKAFAFDLDEMELLWDTALRIEDGQLSLAERDLRAAERAGLPMDPALAGTRRYPSSEDAPLRRSSVFEAALRDAGVPCARHRRVESADWASAARLPAGWIRRYSERAAAASAKRSAAAASRTVSRARSTVRATRRCRLAPRSSGLSVSSVRRSPSTVRFVASSPSSTTAPSGCSNAIGNCWSVSPGDPLRHAGRVLRC